MTDEEEFHLKMDLIWYQKRFENLEPNVKKFIRWGIALNILIFVYGVGAGVLVF